MPNEQPSPDNITTLQPDEVFVYGANLSGRHGKGAALQALKFGAIRYRIGFCGQTYGIATKGKNLEILPLDTIIQNIKWFLLEASRYPEKKFLVTAIGCGLAGYKPEQIAPIFKQAPNNIYIPQSFLDVLNHR